MANACTECRTRKLRCNRARPQCGTCRELGLACIINTTRQPRGPKKGHVKALKSRIESLERQLQSTENSDRQYTINGQAGDHDETDDNVIFTRESSDGWSDQMETQSMTLSEWQPTMPALDTTLTPVSLDNEWNKQMDSVLDPTGYPMLTAPPSTAFNYPLEGSNVTTNVNGTRTDALDMGAPITPPFTGTPAVQMSDLERADLNDLFFDRAHVFAPILNPQRYYARASRASEDEPFTCLQHATWTLASSMGSQFKNVQPVLYAQSRSMLDVWERNSLDDIVPIELVQAWLLLAMYDIVKNNSQRGWISAGRCFRLVHLLKLHEVDNPEATHANLCPVEIEERRRTFWAAYALDRYANLVNGLPLTLNEHGILTHLPAPEASFRSQQPGETEFLASAIAKSDHMLSPFANTVVMVTVLGRCLSHQSQCNMERIVSAQPKDSLTRHMSLDDVLNHVTRATSSAHIEHCDPVVLFVDMLAQVSVLVLFAALMLVRDDTDMYRDAYVDYEKKAAKAAERMHSLVQKLSQLGHFKVHPFTPIMLHICAKYARRRNDVTSSTQFQAMSTALQDMSPANNLAMTCLLELEPGRRTLP